MLLDAGCVVCKHGRGPVCGDCVCRLRPAPALAVSGLDRSLSVYEFDDTMRTVVAAFKYQRQRRLARWFAGQAEPLLPRAADVITWLPATPIRRRERGFDQAQELARMLGRLSGIPVRSLLQRRTTDQRQTGQGRSARLHGPQLTATAPSPPFVVLVDDVTTTGSSLRVGASGLRAAGADRIVGLTMAATPLRYETVVSVT